MTDQNKIELNEAGLSAARKAVSIRTQEISDTKSWNGPDLIETSVKAYLSALPSDNPCTKSAQKRTPYNPHVDEVSIFDNGATDDELTKINKIATDIFNWLIVNWEKDGELIADYIQPEIKKIIELSIIRNRPVKEGDDLTGDELKELREVLSTVRISSLDYGREVTVRVRTDRHPGDPSAVVHWLNTIEKLLVKSLPLPAHSEGKKPGR